MSRGERRTHNARRAPPHLFLCSPTRRAYYLKYLMLGVSIVAGAFWPCFLAKRPPGAGNGPDRASQGSQLRSHGGYLKCITSRLPLFDLKYALSSGGPPLLESGVQSKRGKSVHLELRVALFSTLLRSVRRAFCGRFGTDKPFDKNEREPHLIT